MDPSELHALIKLSKVGLDALSSRMLSFTCLLGVIALAFYVAWRPDWPSVAVLGIMAVLVFIPALRAESLRLREIRGGPPQQ